MVSPRYIFHGEEVLIAARIWTSGWDMYTPIVNIVSHVYGGRTKNVHVGGSHVSACLVDCC